MYKFWINL